MPYCLNLRYHITRVRLRNLLTNLTRISDLEEIHEEIRWQRMFPVRFIRGRRQRPILQKDSHFPFRGENNLFNCDIWLVDGIFNSFLSSELWHNLGHKGKPQNVGLPFARGAIGEWEEYQSIKYYSTRETRDYTFLPSQENNEQLRNPDHLRCK